MSDQQEEKESQEAGVQQEGYGSLERGIAGQFDFSISNIINEAWERTKGNKGTIWLAFIIYIVIAGLVMAAIKHIMAAVGLNPPDMPELSLIYMGGSFISNVLAYAVIGPLGMGFFMLGLKVATEQPREATDIFNYYSYIVKLFVTYLTMYVLIIVGLCLFVLPGIYLMVAYSFALPLVVDKNLSTWQALETSRKAINHIWFRFFGLGLLMIVLIIVAAIPLLIGWIWVIPMMMIAYGIAYRTVFGVERSVTVEA